MHNSPLGSAEDVFGQLLSIYPMLIFAMVVMLLVVRVVGPFVSDVIEERARKRRDITAKQEKEDSMVAELKAKERQVAQGILKRSDYGDWLREQMLKLQIFQAQPSQENQQAVAAMLTKLEQHHSSNSDAIIRLSGEISALEGSVYNVQQISQEWSTLETEFAAVESTMR